MIALVWVATPLASAMEHQYPLEELALTKPERVLEELPAHIEAAQGNHRMLSMLALAEANACRVLARWQCQQSAGERAAAEGQRAQLPALEARGLIATARARIHQGDFYVGELQLADAEKLLDPKLHRDLLADVHLGYSALSHRLGRHKIAAEYARKGIAVLGANGDTPTRVRLLRNLSRALAAMEDWNEAKAALSEARQLMPELRDPKLLAEIALEEARIARQLGDIDTQRLAAQQIQLLAKDVKNTQLDGLGDELRGYLAEQENEEERARAYFRAAALNFKLLGLGSDEIRVIDKYLQLALNQPELSDWVERRLQLAAKVDAAERARAAEVFEERLRYAEQELAFVRLQSQAALLRSERSFYAVLTALVVLLALGLASFIVLQRRSNTRLREALQVRQRAMLQTSHEMRNALVAIRGLSERLRNQPLPSPIGEMLLTIARGAEHLSALAQDLFDRGRIEAGQLRLSPRPTVLRDLLHQVHRLHVPLAREKGLDLLLEEALDGVPELDIDATRLEQVLTNLLANALKFTDQGKVVLSVRAVGESGQSERITFTLTDSGPGIPEAEIPLLFRPFSQTAVGRQHASGAGLGLAISHDLVALMGGKLRVQNVRPHGSAFAFELQFPRSQARPLETAPSLDACSDLKVVVVDDDPLVCAIHDGMLQHLGVRPRLYATVTELLSDDALTQADVLVLDYELADGDSIARLPQLRERAKPELRVVVVSGYAAPERLPDLVDEWIQKPTTAGRFATMLAAVKRAQHRHAQIST